jgi:hypothetical protein
VVVEAADGIDLSRVTDSHGRRWTTGGDAVMLSSVEAPASEPKGTRRMAAEMATSRRAASAFMAAHQGKAYAAPLALEAERKARRSLADSSAGTAAGWCRRQPLVAAHSYFFRHVCRARPTAARERLATWKVARSVWSGMPPPAGPPQVSQSPATTRAMEKENGMNHDLQTLEIASPGRWRSFLAAVAIACLPLLVHEARAHRSAPLSDPAGLEVPDGVVRWASASQETARGGSTGRSILGRGRGGSTR